MLNKILQKKTGLLTLLAIALSSLAGACAHTGTHLPVKPAPEAAELLPKEPQGPSVSDIYASGMADLREKRSDDAIEKLTLVAQAFPDSEFGARASFILANELLAKDLPGAEKYFLRAAQLTHIRDYALFNYAAYLRKKGELFHALAIYNKIVSEHQDSVLLPEAVYQRAIIYGELGDALGERASLEDYITAYKKSRRVPEALLRIAWLSLQENRTAEASKALKRLWLEFPAQPAAQDAQALIEELWAKGLMPEPAPDERYSRAQKLFNASRWSEAAKEFSTAAEEATGTDALLRAGIARLRMKDYEAAEKILSEYASKQGPNADEAMYWLLVSKAKQSRTEDFGKIEKAFAKKYPKSPFRAKALVYLGNHYRDNDSQKSLEAYKLAISDFKGSPDVEEAVWNVGWTAYKNGGYKEAFSIFSEYRGKGSKSKNSIQYIYWAGRSAELLKDQNEAAAIFREVCEMAGSNYYCLMAQARLKALESSGVAVQQPAIIPAMASIEAASSGNGPQDEQTGLNNDRHYAAAKDLLDMGFRQNASAELDLLSRKYSSDQAILLEIASLLYDAGDYYKAFKILRTNNPAGERPFQLKLIDIIKERSPEGAADPFLIAAIMKEESAFNPKAISRAGALGLMQIMPETGKFIAKKLGIEAVEPTDLLEPDTSIQMGSWYLGHLARRFENDLVLTIAGYNAGPNAAAKWAKSRPADLDEFIESIPYSETRAYAKRVLKSYTEYLKLAGLDVSAVFSRPIVADIFPETETGGQNL